MRCVFLFFAFVCYVSSASVGGAETQMGRSDVRLFFPPPSGFVDHKTYDTFVNTRDTIRKRILDAAKKKDYVQIQKLLQEIHQKHNEPDWFYINTVSLIIFTFQWDVPAGPPVPRDVAAVQRGIIRLGNSVVEKKLDADFKTQLDIMLNSIARFEFQYNAHSKKMSASKLLASPLIRKKRVEQTLRIWANLLSVVDNNWTLDSPYPVDKAARYAKVMGTAISIIIDEQTKEITDPYEREAAREKLRPTATEECKAELERMSGQIRHYRRQKELHRLVEEYESQVVDFIAALYSVSPYNTEELKNLLKTHNMSEEFTSAIIERLPENTE